MSALIRSGSLTHYADVARRAGLEAQGAYPRVLAKPHTYLGYARELPASWKALTGPHS